MPRDHGVPFQVGQMGFFLTNRGADAYEVQIEEFEVEPGIWVAGGEVAFVEGNGTGFALVWKKGYSGLAINSEKWDLLGHMAIAAGKVPGAILTKANYGVPVCVVYRDDSNLRYRSCTELVYIPSHNRLKFGATNHYPAGSSSGRVNDEAPQAGEGELDDAIQSIWQVNHAQLKEAIDLLQALAGFSKFRAALYGQTEPIFRDLQSVPVGSPRSIDLFDVNAGLLLALVKDHPTRDAYLEILRNVYFPESYVFLIGSQPADYVKRFGPSEKFGAGYANELSAEMQSRVHRLDERFRFWQHRAYQQAGDALSLSSRDLSVERQVKRSKPERRDAKSLRIDSALKQIAESRPRSHKEIFRQLDDMRVSKPLAEPFASSASWSMAFNSRPKKARPWLSKRWHELGLPTLPKGPKRSLY